MGSIYQGKPVWAHIFDKQPNEGPRILREVLKERAVLPFLAAPYMLCLVEGWRFCALLQGGHRETARTNLEKGEGSGRAGNILQLWLYTGQSWHNAARETARESASPRPSGREGGRITGCSNQYTSHCRRFAYCQQHSCPQEPGVCIGKEFLLTVQRFGLCPDSGSYFSPAL